MDAIARPKRPSTSAARRPYPDLHDHVMALDKAGLRMPLADSYIAATARRHRLTIVTGNDRDFRRPGVAVFNPFKELT